MRRASASGRRSYIPICGSCDCSCFCSGIGSCSGPKSSRLTYSNPYFHVSKQEMEREGPSYSLLTLQELHAKYGDDKEYYFITGSDTINELHTWYHVDELLKKCHFVGTTRPGAPIDFTALQHEFGDTANKRVHALNVPELAISSTDIRKRVKLKKSIRYLVPEPVAEYIEKEGLYR